MPSFASSPAASVWTLEGHPITPQQLMQPASSRSPGLPRRGPFIHLLLPHSAQSSPLGPTWVLLSVWELNLNIIVPSYLLDSGTFGAHDGSMELLGYGTFYGHLGFLGAGGPVRGTARKKKIKAKVNCLGSVHTLSLHSVL